MNKTRSEVIPINKFENDNLGHAEMKIKLTLTNLAEDDTKVFDRNYFSLFNGLAWESELLWIAVNFMINQFGYGRSELYDAFEDVMQHLEKP